MKNLNRDILSLATPSILANITVPLVGMADIAVAGHLGGSSGAAALIGGITIGTMLFDLLYWNFSFLRSGTGGLTAQAYGASLADEYKNAGKTYSSPTESASQVQKVAQNVLNSHGMTGPDRASHAASIKAILWRALRIAVISGVALIAMQWVVLWLAFLFVDCSPEVRELASQYFKIRVWAAPATLSLFAFKGWFIGLQDTVRPMIADLLVNGLNIALSFGLGFGLCGLPAMGFAGVAAGTVIAQWCGFTYAALAARHALGQLRTQKTGILCPDVPSGTATGTKTAAFVSAAALGSPDQVGGDGIGIQETTDSIMGNGTVIQGAPDSVMRDDTVIQGTSDSVMDDYTVIQGTSDSVMRDDTVIQGPSDSVMGDYTVIQGTPDSVMGDYTVIQGTPDQVGGDGGGVMHGTETHVMPGTTIMPNTTVIPDTTVMPDADRASHAPAGAFFKMNRDLVLRSLGMIAVYIGFTVISARYGDTMLAVSSILMKLLLVFSYFTDGFAYAGEALTGKFIGAQDREGVQSAVRGTFLWGWGLAGAFMLLYGLGGVPAFRLLTSDATVVEAGKEFILWLLLMPVIGVPAFIWDGIFTGATETGAMRNSTLLCAVGFFAVWFGGLWLVGAVSGSAPDGSIAIHILMAAYFVHLAIRSIYLTVVRKRILPVKADKPVEVK